MTPQTVTITTARGETFTMNFDGPVSVEVKDVPLSPFEVGDIVNNEVNSNKTSSGIVYSGRVSGNKVTSLNPFAIGDTVEWTDKRLGKKSGVVTDTIGHALKIGEHVTIWDHDARKVTPSSAPKFKVGDVVYWETDSGARYFVKVLTVYAHQVRAEVLEPHALCQRYKPGYIVYCSKENLHHDYRTVAGGGWRKCEVGKRYKTSIKDVRAAKTHFHDENGYRVGGVNFDLIEELP